MPRSPAYVGVRCRSVLLDSDEGGSDIIGPSGGGGRKIKYASMDAARTKSISLRRVATRSRSRSIAGLRSWWKAQEHRLSGTTRTSRNARPECTDHGVHCSGLRAFDQAGARPDLLHLQRRSNRPAREDSLSARLVGRVRLVAIVVAIEARSAQSAVVRRRQKPLFHKGFVRCGTTMNMILAGWQCGGQGFESPQLHSKSLAESHLQDHPKNRVVAVIVPLPSSTALIRSAVSRARAGMTCE